MKKWGSRVALPWQIAAVLVLALSTLIGSPLPAAADSAGEITVQPVAGKTLADVDRAFGTRTLFAFTDSTAGVVWTTSIAATTSAMNADLRAARPTLAWFETNAPAKDPRATDDSSSDPYCPPPPAGVQPPVSAADDSSSDQRCTRVISNGKARYEGQYAATKMSVAPAWSKTKGQGAVVAVVDTQIDVAHEVLAGRTLPAIDLVPASPMTNVPTNGASAGHGTFVAGLVLRVAPQAKVLPVRVLNEDGRGSTGIVAEGIRRAAKAGADVINLSLSTSENSRALREAVAYARQHGAAIVASYGNEGESNPAVFPADYPGVISVVATDQNDVRATFSNYGRDAGVAAPGVNVVSSYRNGQYGIGSGTSYAAALVSGETALVTSAFPRAPWPLVNLRVTRQADDIDAENGLRDRPGFQLGYGRADAAAAVTRP